MLNARKHFWKWSDISNLFLIYFVAYSIIHFSIYVIICYYFMICHLYAIIYNSFNQIIYSLFYFFYFWFINLFICGWSLFTYCLLSFINIYIFIVIGIVLFHNCFCFSTNGDQPKQHILADKQNNQLPVV